MAFKSRKFSLDAPCNFLNPFVFSLSLVKKLDFMPEKIAFADLGPDTVRVMLRGLEPDSQYRIFIRAYTKEGKGKEYFIDVRTNSDLVGKG